MTKQINFGGNNVNIEGGLHIKLTKCAVDVLLAYGVFKKVQDNNVMVTWSKAEIRKANRNFCGLVTTLLLASLFFFFVYPLLWRDIEGFQLFTSISDLVSGAFLMAMIGCLKYISMVCEAICRNARKLKENR